jgi:hypothetical protein
MTSEETVVLVLPARRTPRSLGFIVWSEDTVQAAADFSRGIESFDGAGGDGQAGAACEGRLGPTEVGSKELGAQFARRT